MRTIITVFAGRVDKPLRKPGRHSNTITTRRSGGGAMFLWQQQILKGGSVGGLPP